MAVTLVNGCANSSALIRASSTSIRTDVFQELANGEIVPPGHADLRIAFSLKTHRPGVYSARDIHGTPDYRLLLNIDGQAIQLPGSLREENIEPRGLQDPEAGDGIRYRFTSRLRLRAGTHRVVIAMPADDIAEERVITLPEGSSNSLVLEPVYRTAPGKLRPGRGLSGGTTYSEGLRGFRMVLNGKPI